jgi:hypothetical protein
MDLLANDYRAGLFDAQEPPCLSLYQPTHRRHPENQQDPIRYGNLLKTMKESLQRKYPDREIRRLLEPFEALAVDRNFWNHTLDGLAVLGSLGVFRAYRLQRPFPELVVAAESFHTKPLMRILQSADYYQILGVNRQGIKLFEGNRDVLDEMEPAEGVPRTITEALGDELTDPHQTVASYGMGAAGPAMRHGHGSKKDEVDIDTTRFFRAVDRAILEHHSRPSGLPLLLAALPEYHAPFREVSRNPFLMAEAIDTHPDALDMDELRERAWRIFEPRYRARLSKLVEDFSGARSKGLGGVELSQVAEAAVSGRIGTLLLEAERQVPGRIDPNTGGIEFVDLADPEVDDLLDDLGEMVLKRGGEVVIVPADAMPSPSGAAAIYRF